MMSPDRFALWKFKIIEGQIICTGYDFTTTKIITGFNVYYIHYDSNNEMATIKCASNPMFKDITVPFNGLVEQLKKLCLWAPRSEIEQHASARIPFT